MENKTNINWFPGHMTKANRLMQEHLKAIDIVVELRDARIPMASENPMLQTLAQHKLKVYIFNKTDLADPLQTKVWQTYFDVQGINTLFIDATKASSRKLIVDAIEKAGELRRERDARRGIKNRPLKVMVVGIPNIGKSTLINLLASKKLAKVANRPGITRTTTWINISKHLILMDTPGVLWPKFDDQSIGIKLALTNAIKEQILPIEQVCEYGYAYLMKHYQNQVLKRYELDTVYAYHDFLKVLAEHKNMLLSKNELDIQRAQLFFFNDIKDHHFSGITWERPDELV